MFAKTAIKGASPLRLMLSDWKLHELESNIVTYLAFLRKWKRCTTEYTQFALFWFNRKNWIKEFINDYLWTQTIPWMPPKLVLSSVRTCIAINWEFPVSMQLSNCITRPVVLLTFSFLTLNRILPSLFIHLFLSQCGEDASVWMVCFLVASVRIFWCVLCCMPFRHSV